jgi:hypothetical protein
MEKSKAYWAALLLHPAYKKRWIELYLGQQQQNTILCTFKTFYLEKYSNLESRPTELTTIQQPKESQGFLIEDDFYAPQQPSTALSEVDDYFKDLPLPCTDPIAWWAEREIKYPRLSRMAFDILTIPAMSSEPERVFSRGGLVISSQRHSINAKTLEMLLCLQHWLKDETG